MIKLYNGDCIEKMGLIKDKSVDLIVTDPPYLMSYKSNRSKNKDYKFNKEIENDSNEEFIKNYIKECYRIMKDNTAIYLFCNSNKIEFFKTEVEKYFTIKNIIIWVKNNHTAGDLEAQFGKQYEMIILANKGRKKFNGKRITDVWFFDKVSSSKAFHQNQKPIDLLEQCIIKHSNENDIVFDGCMGSGSTGVACKNLNRSFIGIELDKNYYNICKERLDYEKD